MGGWFIIYIAIYISKKNYVYMPEAIIDMSFADKSEDKFPRS